MAAGPPLDHCPLFASTRTVHIESTTGTWDKRHWPEIGMGMFGGDHIVTIPHQDIFINLDGLIEIAAFDITFGLISY
jgi:hypothetical protein